MRTDLAIEEKSAVNLRIRTALKEKARDLGVNLSQTLEQEAWIAENQRAISAYNTRVEAQGPALAAYKPLKKAR